MPRYLIMLEVATYLDAPHITEAITQAKKIISDLNFEALGKVKAVEEIAEARS